MANLSGLIRVRKHTVDEKQKALSDLYRRSEELAAERAGLLNALEEEREKVSEMDVQMLSYFGPYSEAVQERVGDLDKVVDTLEKRIRIAQEDMRQAFSELKKVEITQARRVDEEKKEINKKESDELDEMAIEGFRRKQEEGE